MENIFTYIGYFFVSIGAVFLFLGALGIFRMLALLVWSMRWSPCCPIVLLLEEQDTRPNDGHVRSRANNR